MSIDTQALREAELLELNELLRGKVEQLEEKLWNTDQLRKVHSEKSFELEGKVRELEARNQKDFVWRGQEIGRLNDEVDELKEKLQAAEKRIAELEKGHCGAPLLEREEAHVKTVSGLLAELGKWQQESSTWQSVAEKQLAIAIEAEKRIAELTAPDGNAIAWESTTPVYIKFITDERYQKLRPGYQKWYKPYRCSNCAAGITVKGE